MAALRTLRLAQVGDRTVRRLRHPTHLIGEVGGQDLLAHVVVVDPLSEHPTWLARPHDRPVVLRSHVHVLTRSITRTVVPAVVTNEQTEDTANDQGQGHNQHFLLGGL